MELDQQKLRELIEKAQSGNKDAKEILIEKNLGLVWSIVPRFLNRGYESEDIFQLGCIGLVKAIDKFDLSREVMFSTYAIPMIIGEIRRFLRDHGNIKISRCIKTLAFKAKHVKEELVKKNGEEPTINELADYMKVPVEDLVIAMDSIQPITYLEDVIYEGDGNTIQRGQSLFDDNQNDDTWVDTITLKELISRLNSKERQVITLRYFKDMTQQGVADILGVSQVQVSRIEKKALMKMKKDLS